MDRLRWGISAEVEIYPRQPGRSEDDEMVFKDAATCHYPADWTEAQCAADFLRELAKDIESGHRVPRLSGDEQEAK